MKLVGNYNQKTTNKIAAFNSQTIAATDRYTRAKLHVQHYGLVVS